MKLIPFLHEVKYDLTHTHAINQAFEMAPAALPQLVHLGYQLMQTDPESLKGLMSFIEDLVPSLDSRIVMEYTLTLASARVVSCISCRC